ncbi:uncharacterized protein [Centruroides vittatus]|uniref:uncharacterized protein n=1 Tax=Centruroides vittatus TaxID=120091 RepID=UPI00350ED051
MIILTVLALVGGEIENAAKSAFHSTSLYFRTRMKMTHKLKFLCFMKRLGGPPITVTCMGFFAINKTFICRAYKALSSSFTTILEIQNSEKHCLNSTEDMWKEFI